MGLIELIAYLRLFSESIKNIRLSSQGMLLNHFKLVIELNDEVIRLSANEIMEMIVLVCERQNATTIVTIGI